MNTHLSEWVRPKSYKTDWNTPEPCPVCHGPAKELTWRKGDIGCASATCRFQLHATSIWTWNESVRALSIKPVKIKLPVVPRLVLRLELLAPIATVRVQVVEQNLRGLEFNEACRIKGIDKTLRSDVYPDIIKSTLLVRGTKKASDEVVATKKFDTLAEATVFHNAVLEAARAYNDNVNLTTVFPETPARAPDPPAKPGGKETSSEPGAQAGAEAASA